LAADGARHGPSRRHSGKSRPCETSVRVTTLAAALARTGEIEIGPNQRRAAQRGEDAALLWWFAGDRPLNSRSNPHSLGVVFGKPLRQRPDQLAVGFQATYLKPRYTAFDQPAAIIPERSLLRGIAHGRRPARHSGAWNNNKRMSSNKTEASLPPFSHSSIRSSPTRAVPPHARAGYRPARSPR
jgi:hypothetical protein